MTVIKLLINRLNLSEEKMDVILQKKGLRADLNKIVTGISLLKAEWMFLPLQIFF